MIRRLPLATAVLALGLTAACGGTSGTTDDAPQAGNNRPTASAEPPADAAPAEPVEEEPEQSTTLAFGESFTYDDGLTVTVEAPTPFVPTESAAGAERGSPVAFNITVVNGTAGNFDPALFTATAQSANVEASQIYDFGGGLEGSPSTTLLPGREAVFKLGFAVTDPADIVLEVSPDFEHENAIYTTTP